MVKLKKSARIAGLKPEMVLGIMLMKGVFDKYDRDLVITSALDSSHGRGSLHFVGQALDLRTRHLQENTVGPIVSELEEALGPDFDVILEGNHIHVEFQPKTGINK